MMKVILLTHDSNISKALANLIVDSGINLTKVVIIRKIAKTTPRPASKPHSIFRVFSKSNWQGFRPFWRRERIFDWRSRSLFWIE